MTVNDKSSKLIFYDYLEQKVDEKSLKFNILNSSQIEKKYTKLSNHKILKKTVKLIQLEPFQKRELQVSRATKDFRQLKHCKFPLQAIKKYFLQQVQNKMKQSQHVNSKDKIFNREDNQPKYHYYDLESRFNFSSSFHKGPFYFSDQVDQRPIEQDVSNIQVISFENQKRTKAKNIAQLLSSKCLTQIPKIIASRGKKERPKKQEISEQKAKLKHFLQDNQAKASQLILLFVYLYLQFQSAEAYEFQKVKAILLKYLQKKDKEATAQSAEEREKLKKKIQINRILVIKYFNPQKHQIDPFWIKEACRQLYTGKHRETIDKPIKALIVLQKTLREEHLQPNLIVSPNYFSNERQW